MTKNSAFRSYDINVRVLALQVLGRWRSILALMLLFALALPALRVNWSAAAPAGAGEDDPFATERRQVEFYQSYRDRLLEEIRLIQEHLTQAPRCRIDPAKAAVATLEIALRQEDETRPHSMDALSQAYTRALREGDYLTGLAEELGTRREYVSELIETETAEEKSVAVPGGDKELTLQSTTIQKSSAEEYAVIALRIIAPDPETAARIASAAEGELPALTEALSGSLLPHTAGVLSRQSYVTEDRELAAERRELYDRIDSLDDELKDVYTKLEEKTRALSGAEASAAAALRAASSAGRGRSAVKNAVLGLILGLILGLGFWCVWLLFLGRRFASADEFYARYTLNRLGVLPPEEKTLRRRSAPLDRWVRDRCGDGDGRSESECLALTAAGIAGYAGGAKRLVLTGCGSADKLRALGEKLRERLPGTELVIAPDFARDPEAMEALSGAEGVILAEERGVSLYEQINAELSALQALGKPIVGSVIL